MKIIRREQNDNNRRGMNNYHPLRSMVDDFFRIPSVWNDLWDRSTQADIWEDDQNVYVKVATPGIKEEDLNISVNGNSLRISGESKIEEKEDSQKRYYVQRMESRIEENFALPTGVNPTNTTARYENGVVTVTLPKSEESKARQIKINNS